MNFDNQFNYTLQQTNTSNQYKPLTIQTNIQTTLQHNSIWSPFSTPSFSPYSSNLTSPFQYSNFYSPNLLNATRPISKTYSNTKFSRNKILNPTNNQTLMNNENYKPNIEYEMRRNLPKRSDKIDMSEIIQQAAIQRAMGGRAKLCTFCKTNGESEEIYSSHSLKDSNDNITCPILMRYSCPVCGASGEKTHTKKYCPKLQKMLRLEMLTKMSNNENKILQ